ncbi:MAG: glutamine synthetase, partial [Actinomycetota bacterium]
MLQTDLVNVSRGRAMVDEGSGAGAPPTVGWVPADLGLDAFGGLVDPPWGAVGDIRLRPRPGTLAEIDPGRDAPPFRFVLADCVEHDGDRWAACPTKVLQEALKTLETEFGLRLRAGIEHEFALRRPEHGLPFSIDAARRAEPLLSDIVAGLEQAGLQPEHILPEFGNNQFEVTIEPDIGEAAADRAVMTREIVREVARANGEAITFAPIIGVAAGGNGAHIHSSLVDESGDSIMEAANGPFGLSDRARSFAAGIMAHLPALTALTAPSVASYLRLRPGHWSAAYQAFGVSNRETALRLSPGRPEGGGGRRRLGPSLELRSVDATARYGLAFAS